MIYGRAELSGVISCTVDVAAYHLRFSNPEALREGNFPSLSDVEKLRAGSRSSYYTAMSGN